MESSLPGVAGKWQDGRRAERLNTWGSVPFLMGNLVTLLGWGTAARGDGQEIHGVSGMMICLGGASHHLLEQLGLMDLVLHFPLRHGPCIWVHRFFFSFFFFLPFSPSIFSFLQIVLHLCILCAAGFNGDSAPLVTGTFRPTASTR